MKNGFSKLCTFALLTTCTLGFRCDKKENPVAPISDVDNTNSVATVPFSFEIDVTNHTTLRLEAINGNIILIGEIGGSSVILTGERKVGSENMADAEAYLSDLEVSVSDLGDEILIKTSQPSETHGRSYIVNYNIRLPQDLIVDVSSTNGTVMIDSTEKDVLVNLSNGQVTLNHLIGPLDIDLTNGQIEAIIVGSPTGAPMIAAMSTVNGNVELDIPQSASAVFSARVGNGIITTSNLSIQNLSQTANSLSGTLGAGEGSIRLETTNGNIHVNGY